METQSSLGIFMNNHVPNFVCWNDKNNEQETDNGHIEYETSSFIIKGKLTSARRGMLVGAAIIFAINCFIAGGANGGMFF